MTTPKWLVPSLPPRPLPPSFLAVPGRILRRTSRDFRMVHPRPVNLCRSPHRKPVRPTGSILCFSGTRPGAKLEPEFSTWIVGGNLEGGGLHVPLCLKLPPAVALLGLASDKDDTPAVITHSTIFPSLRSWQWRLDRETLRRVVLRSQVGDVPHNRPCASSCRAGLKEVANMRTLSRISFLIL